MLKEFTSGWVKDGVVLTLNTEGLTDNEVAVMIASRTNNFSDIYESGQDWSFGVCDQSGLSEKVYRGVVASLVKKGFVAIYDGDTKQFRDKTFTLTDAGKALFGAIEGQPKTEEAPKAETKLIKDRTTDELAQIAKDMGLTWKECTTNEPINRMRIIMAMKKAVM